MATSAPLQTTTRDTSQESSLSAVSWSAILCGAFTAIAITIILTFLGAGLNLSTISPWSQSGVSASTFSITTGISLIVVQWISSGVGGYMTGRLRTRWVGVHTHEVFFRDTAHGFMAWTVATVVTVMLIASSASSLIGGGLHAAGSTAGTMAQAFSQPATQLAQGVSGYDVDTLFRSDRLDANTNPQLATAQATRILAHGLTSGDVSPADRATLAQLIATRTGISQPDAQKRVDDVIAGEKAAVTKAAQVVDATRKASASLAIFTALSMLIGAFIASAAAAYAGGLRDDHETMNRPA